MLERQIKVDNLAEQVAKALAKTDHAEAHHTESFKQKGGAIKAHIGELEAKRAELIAQLDPAMAQRYEALRAEKNGVAVSCLEDDIARHVDRPSSMACSPSCARATRSPNVPIAIA